MFEANKAMIEASRDAVDRRNKLVIQKGETDFQQARTLIHEIKEFEKTDHNQIPEDQFIHVFLPFFARDPEREYPQVTIDHWIGATGDTFKPVDVVNSRGEVITMQDGTKMTIPAVFNRNALRTMVARQNGNNAATGQIMDEAKKYENMGAATVQQVMGRYLAQKANAAKVPGQSLATATMWNKIMAHYKRPPLYSIPGETPNAGNAASQDPQSPPSSGVDDTYYELP